MAKSSREKIQEDERKILATLTKNSKENVDRIAKQCGFSRQKTWRLIKQLEIKNLIWGYTAIFDETKVGLNHFMLILKRTIKPIGENTINVIITRELEKISKDLDITIESSLYVHGEYDWVITFTAKDIKQAKKFSNLLVTLHPGVIADVQILQTLMFIRRHYILNPERKKLKDFL